MIAASQRRIQDLRTLSLGLWLGTVALGCSGTGGTTANTRAPQAQNEAELVALRRQNDALTRELEFLRDRGLMCAKGPQPAMSDAESTRLVPETAAPVAQETRRPRGVSLSDLPHSAPDAAVMERYAASAASPNEGPELQDPKQYRLVGQATAPGPKGAQAIYAKARKHYMRGERAKARALFKQIEQEHASSDLADNAAYWLAEDDRDAGRIQAAQAGFMRVLSDYPSGNKVEDAMYMLALCFKAQSQFDQARLMLRKVASAGRKELRRKARKELANLKTQGSGTESMNGR